MPEMDDRDLTLELLGRAKTGDREALDRLFEGQLLRLRRWATGRLPRWARNMAETSDLVQETVLQTFRRLEQFEYRGEGSLDAYLRGAFMNRLKDEFRRTARSGGGDGHTSLDTSLPDPSTAPDEMALRQELVEKYEHGLQLLSKTDRDLIVCRLELEMTYQEIATFTGRKSADAARVAVARSLIRLASYLEPAQS